MITFFDLPYNEELLYGWLARNQFFNGINSRQFNMNLYGKRIFYQSLHYHRDLNKLIDQSPNLTLEDLNLYHTLTPLYRLFNNVEDNNALLTNNKSHGFWRQDSNYDRIKLCPLCCKEDIVQFGEFYIHRIHQIPGIEICNKHRVLLHGFNYSHEEFFDISNIDINSLSIGTMDYSLEAVYMDLLRDVAYILEGNLEDHTNLDLREKYYQRLRERGYMKGTLLKDSALEKDVLNFYGDSFLKYINLPIENNGGSSWVMNFISKDNCSVNIIKNLLIIQFLFGSAQELKAYKNIAEPHFGDGPWNCYNQQCLEYNKPVITNNFIYYNSNKRCFAGEFVCPICGYKYGLFEKNDKPYFIWFGDLWELKVEKMILDGELAATAIANQMKCHLQTIKRFAKKKGLLSHLENKKNKDLKSQYRKDIIDYLICHPTTKISDIEGKLQTQYLYLKRNDKEWIDTLLADKKELDKELYWIDRDLEMCEAITQEVSAILGENRKIRITMKFLSRLPRCGAILQHRKYIDRIPNTLKLLQMCCESEEQYHARINRT